MSDKIKYVPALIIFVTMMIFISCVRPESEPLTLESPIYFPVSDYILKDYKNNRKQFNLEKSIIINGQIDTKNIAGPIQPSEIEILEQININSPKYVGFYSGDTTYSLSGEIEKITYVAIEPEAVIKNIIINFSHGKTDRIYVRSSNSSLISIGKQELEYRFGIGYQLSTMQKVLLRDTLNLKINATFVKPK